MESLRGATMVITGASSGIGLATAQAFAQRHEARLHTKIPARSKPLDVNPRTRRT